MNRTPDAAPTVTIITPYLNGEAYLSEAIASGLFVEDVETHFRRGQDYAEPEIFGDEWVPAPPLPIAVPA